MITEDQITAEAKRMVRECLMQQKVEVCEAIIHTMAFYPSQREMALQSLKRKARNERA